MTPLATAPQAPTPVSYTHLDVYKRQDEGRAAEVAKVQAVLERFGAKIEKVDDWGKRKLAYEIQKVNEGFYSFTTFEAPAAAPAEIEARMRIMENVLRYLIIRKEA